MDGLKYCMIAELFKRDMDNSFDDLIEHKSRLSMYIRINEVTESIRSRHEAKAEYRRQFF
jgi:hypothetical protein